MPAKRGPVLEVLGDMRSRSWLAAILFTFLMPTFAHAVELVISVDWEGRDLREENLRAMNEFRNRHPEIKMVHFLNAAYFTKAGIDRLEVAQKMRSVLRSGDEYGLHVHAWKTLFRAAGVDASVRDQNSLFWNHETPPEQGDRGHDVMIEAYSVEQLRAVLRYSRETLEANGFGKITSFRGGGWTAGPKVLEALVREGFTVDSSAVPPVLLRDGLKKTPLLDRISQTWKEITPFSRAFAIDTIAGRIFESPNTFGLADYVHPITFMELARQAYARDGANAKIHYGFHQETAARYLDRVETSLKRLKRFLWWRRVQLVSTTIGRTKERSCRALF